MKKFSPFFLSLISGTLYAFAYPSFAFSGAFLFLFLGLIPFLRVLETIQPMRSIAFCILLFNLGLNLTGYYWIPHTLQEFGQLPYSISFILSLLFTFILQPHWWIYLIWLRFRPSFKWSSSLGILISACLMTILERFTPQQFPSFVGSPWLHLKPYLGLAPIFGSVIYSFFTFWISLEFIQQFKTKKIRYSVWISTIFFIILNLLFPLNQHKILETQLKARLVQANIGNFIKISSEFGDKNSYESVRKKYQDLSLAGLDFQPELIIWPETAYPDTFFGPNSNVNYLFKKIMKRTGAELLIGGYDHNLSKPRHEFIEAVFNSSLLLSENKLKTSYHKNILIPFGETLPFGPLNKTIVSIVPAISLFARGEGTPLMETKRGLRFVTPICYEILETNYMRSLLNQYGKNHFIVNHTNDSWYGNTAEPFQHLFLSKWRALEFQLPILRSTNTGITSVIYPDGSESKRLRINEENFLDVSIPISKPEETFYQRFGFFPTLFLMLLLVTFYWISERKESPHEINHEV